MGREYACRHVLSRIQDWYGEQELGKLSPDRPSLGETVPLLSPGCCRDKQDVFSDVRARSGGQVTPSATSQHERGSVATSYGHPRLFLRCLSGCARGFSTRKEGLCGLESDSNRPVSCSDCGRT
jgi:hypothetical protein